jgi:hypothetical protein
MSRKSTQFALIIAIAVTVICAVAYIAFSRSHDGSTLADKEDACDASCMAARVKKSNESIDDFFKSATQSPAK